MSKRLRNLIVATVTLGATLALHAPCHAAAASGEFGIKGIGASDCATAVREYKASSPNAMMYGGWLYGYMTAINQTTPDTFDLATWQDLNTFSNFIIEYCQKNPKTSFAQAVFNMVSALKPRRLSKVSYPVRFARNGRHYVLYGEVINRIVRALQTKGFYKGAPMAKPEFTEELALALARFQIKNKLPGTGEPDQFTLFKLLN